MVCASVMVLPDPVTPSRVWYLSPRRRPSVSSRIALGWSPAGSNGATTSKRGLLMEGNIYCRGFFGRVDRLSPCHAEELLPLDRGGRHYGQSWGPDQPQVCERGF